LDKDILGIALLDYYKGKYTQDIITHSSLGDKDTLPLPYMFRGYKDMPRIEQKALDRCEGRVLDIGCGAGSHALHLQNKGLNVSCLDVSKGAIHVCELRGLTNTLNTNILNYQENTFDTLLLLMNGIGLAGKLNKLDTFLSKLKLLLNPGGQILLDSSDIIYMYDTDEDGGYWIPEDGSYYGEISFEMEYKKSKSDPFDWLYVDYNTLQRAAHFKKLNCEIIHKGEHYDYLAKLTLMM